MAATLWLLLSHLGRTERYEALARSNLTAQAVVTQPDCANHGTLVYRFEVAGRQFESRDIASPSGKDCASYKSGDTVQIVYLPDNPSIDAVGDPGDQLRGERGLVVVASLGMPAFIIWAFARRRRRQSNA
jgi:hypothetical protein